jgi:hypothetical protein
VGIVSGGSQELEVERERERGLPKRSLRMTIMNKITNSKFLQQHPRRRRIDNDTESGLPGAMDERHTGEGNDSTAAIAENLTRKHRHRYATLADTSEHNLTAEAWQRKLHIPYHSCCARGQHNR